MLFFVAMNPPDFNFITFAISIRLISELINMDAAKSKKMIQQTVVGPSAVYLLISAGSKRSFL
jgi:hypothetical protein